MSFLWFCLAWVVGIVAGAFFLVAPLIVLVFAIPFTLRLRRLGVLKSSQPLIQYVVSLVLLPLLFCAATFGMHMWVPKYMVGYWIGVAITLLQGFGKCGANPTNLQEYFERNMAHIDHAAFKQVFPDADAEVTKA